MQFNGRYNYRYQSPPEDNSGHDITERAGYIPAKMRIEQIGQKAYDLILSGIPVEIMKIYKKHSEWMKSGHRVRITGTGIGDRDTDMYKSVGL